MTSKKIYLYFETDLPKEGWFQACINCDLVTSNVLHFKTIKNKKKYILKNLLIYISICVKNVKTN